jgi:hypothetical protein
MNVRYPGAAFLAAALLLAGCARWQTNCQHNGIAFDRLRIEGSGSAIGELAQTTAINDRLCKRGWIHLHPNGVPAAFTTAAPVTVGRTILPLDTWVLQTLNGEVYACAAPYDIEVRGQWCRGTSEPKGVQIAFYPSGALRSFFPAAATTIDGIPCRGGTVNGMVELYENGRMKSCLLDRDLERDGLTVRGGRRAVFDAEGHIVPPTVDAMIPPLS